MAYIPDISQRMYPHISRALPCTNPYLGSTACLCTTAGADKSLSFYPFAHAFSLASGTRLKAVFIPYVVNYLSPYLLVVLSLPLPQINASTSLIL